MEHMSGSGPEAAPTRVMVAGWPAWLRPDGSVMHVIAGGAPEGDPPAGDPPAKTDPPAGDPPGKTDPKTDPKADDPADFGDDVTKWKAFARKHEAEAKKNAEAAKKLKEIEDSKKSDIEKLTEAQRTAERERDEANLRALRLEVAAEKGLTPAQAKRLVGGTKEELEADADELMASFKGDDDAGGSAPRRPRERMRPGTKPGAEPEKSGREIAESIPRSRF